MSYNIDNFKLKRLENFKIPLEALYTCERKDWLPKKPELLDVETNRVKISFGDQHFIGTLANSHLTVQEIELHGEGSGNLRYEILDEAFKKSTGYMEAVLVWEGGDSITKLIVDNGNLTEENIEL